MGFTRAASARLSLGAYLAWTGCMSTAPAATERAAESPASAPAVASAASAAPEDAGAAPSSGASEGESPLAAGALAALPPPSASTSIGSPSNGQLQGGVALPLRAPGLRYNDRRDENARYATVEVIAAIQRAAQAVAQRFPESELIVNDISLPSGGRIAHHGSHRAGRDADILFYLRGDDGNFTPSVGAPIDPQGIGFDFKELAEPGDDLRVHFDADRTWHFVAALLADPEAVVQRIFVAEHLREMLLAAAKKAQAPSATIALFDDVTCQPGYPHDDHLHVRWFCSFEDLAAGCEDLPPLYPWRQDALSAAGLSAKLAARTRSADPAPLTTQADAERAVKRQKPHKDVLAFLARRKAWEKQPHPGRPYCK